MTGAQVTRLYPARARERGIALLIVLWVIVALALLVSAFNATVKSGVSFVGSEVQLSKTEALLDAGVELAAARLIDEDEGRRWAADGRAHVVTFAGARLAISIRDSSGYVDINKADSKLLMGLLRRYSGSESNAARLRDRILLARGKSAGAEPGTAGQPSTPTDDRAGAPVSASTPFVDVAQLRMLTGMSPQVYAAIAPFLTVYSRDGRINPRAAPEQVLISIPGLTLDDVKAVRSLPDRAQDRADERDQSYAEIGQRAGAYLADREGPAYRVTVEVLRPDGASGASAVFVVATGLDQQAPYRLIARKPASVGAVGRGVN